MTLLIKPHPLLRIYLGVLLAVMSLLIERVYAEDNTSSAPAAQLTSAQPSPSETPVTHQPPAASEGIASHLEPWLVFLATMLLAYVTFMLNRTTKEHVTHSRELVKTVGNILKIDRIARLTVSIVNNDKHEPYICLQNVGRVPVMICDLSIKFDSLSQTIGEARTMWILPLKARKLSHPILSGIWGEGMHNKVTVECTFHDVYYDETENKEMLNVKTEWTVDYKKRTITSPPGGNS
jgi:hypothetical protein